MCGSGVISLFCLESYFDVFQKHVDDYLEFIRVVFSIHGRSFYLQQQKVQGLVNTKFSLVSMENLKFELFV